MSQGGGGVSLAPPPAFNAPTEFPGQPVTSGADAGPGPGMSALNLSGPQNDPRDVERLRSYLPALIAQAARPEATQAFRNYVRSLRAEVL